MRKEPVDVDKSFSVRGVCGRSVVSHSGQLLDNVRGPPFVSTTTSRKELGDPVDPSHLNGVGTDSRQESQEVG